MIGHLPLEREGPAPVTEVIRVEHLTKHYGKLTALEDLSFEVAESEVVGLLGPNGAGKTTTIEILEGMRAPSSGRVRVLGRDPLEGGRRMRNRVGTVLQAAGIDATLTVREIVGLYASFYRPRRRPEEVIAEVDLGESASKRVGELSGGQRRRLDLALALVGSPSVLLLDEPTTGLDPAARRRTWEVIERLRDCGVAILLSSHYLDEVQHLADRVVVLSRGRLVGEGPPRGLAAPVGAVARISFRLPEHLEPPPGPWESQGRERGLTVLTTREPQQGLGLLLDWATAQGCDLEELEVRRPSLEERYLELTRGA